MSTVIDTNTDANIDTNTDADIDTNIDIDTNTDTNIDIDKKNTLDIIYNNLQKLNNNTPNIILYGPYNSGKKYILYKFLKNLYKNDEEFNKYTMVINCSFGKGIKYIKNEVKMFSKIIIPKSIQFKSIIFINGDKLTDDAQSALRRCIEEYSKSTRFFIVLNKISNLLKPIISRFVKIYIPKNDIYKLKNNILELDNYNINKKSILKTKLNNLISNKANLEISDIYKVSKNLYNLGYSSNDIIDFINDSNKKDLYLFKINIIFNIIKNDIINELLIMNYILFLLLRYNKNIDLYSFNKYG